MSKKLMTTVATIALIGLALGACQRQKRSEVVVGGRPLVVAAKLDCPETEGKLIRVSVAADGQSCAYKGEGDSEITVSRMVLNNQSPSEAVKAVEASLSPLVPPHRDSSSPEGDNVVSMTTTSGKHHSHFQIASGDDDHANVDLPGVHIHAEGDRAQVKLPGLSINANDDGAQITTSLAGLKNAVIDANDSGAEIRADTTDAGNTDRTWLLVSDEAGPGGYHMVGYMARGPNAGPLVVAQIKSKTLKEHHFKDSFGFEDVKRLIALSAK